MIKIKYNFTVAKPVLYQLNHAYKVNITSNDSYWHYLSADMVYEKKIHHYFYLLLYSY